jgi:hypothetical protein
MASISRLYTFTALTTIASAEVNAELNQVISFLNNDVVHVDGSKALTGLLTLHAADPTADNHAVRKSYVAKWQDHTPTLTASTTNPTLGTGSVQWGRYCKVGTTVVYQGLVKFGTSGINVGSGTYWFSLPVAAATGTHPLGRRLVGAGLATDSSNGNAIPARAWIFDSEAATKFRLYGQNIAADQYSTVAFNTANYAWAINDSFEWHITYEAA